jgi:MATE family multidrug resistance protein
MNSRIDHGATREVVTLAWPIALAMLGETAIGLVDTKLVGALGPAALGGVGIATTLMYLGYSFVLGLMRGVKVRTAHAVGHGQGHLGVRYAWAGLVMAGILGVALFAAAQDVTPVLRALRVDPELIEPARQFLAARGYGAPATCAIAALTQHRQAVGDSRTPMFVGLFGNIVNMGLAYGLIHGVYGLPRLGVRGAGFGTAISEWLELALMLAVLIRETRALPRRAPTLPLTTAAREVFGLGGPTGIQFSAEMLAFTAFTAVLGTLGSAEMAAHQIALSTIRTSFLPGLAVAEAATVLVGQSLGRADLDAADEYAIASVKVGIGFMAVCGLVFAFGGEAIAQVFTDSTEVIRVTRRLLYVAAVFQILDAINIVLRGALRGAKDVRAVALIGVTVIWTCIPTSAYYFGKVLGLGALGGWIGFVLETTLAAALFAWRWRRGAWREEYNVTRALAPT